MYKMNPLITVITSSYQRNKFLLERCIPSVQNQTYKPIEHIIIHDGKNKKLESSKRIIADHLRAASFLLSEGKYFDYLKYGIISFGFYLPPHIIPYPFVNILRNIVTRFLSTQAIKLYFFSVLGYSYYLLLIILTFRSRGKAIFRILLFALFIISVPTLFYSFAFTPYEPFFWRDYGYDENRWRYVSFFGQKRII